MSMNMYPNTSVCITVIKMDGADLLGMLSYHSAAVGGAVLAKYRALTSLNTKGLGPQNLTSIFLMFSRREPSSRHHLE